jgi:hypothetical protein
MNREIERETDSLDVNCAGAVVGFRPIGLDCCLSGFGHVGLASLASLKPGLRAVKKVGTVAIATYLLLI